MEPMNSPEKSTATVGDELDRLDVTASKIGLITTEQAVDLLHRLDAAYKDLQEIDPGGQSRKMAETQFEVIVSRLHNEAAQFIRDLGGAQALQRMRIQENPPVDHSWWYLDQYVAAKQKTSLRRVLVLGGIVAVLLIALVVVYEAFLAPDPQTVALYGHQQSVQDFIMAGDLESALDEANQGLEINPADPELLITKGVILEKLGRAVEAASAFSTAEQALPMREEFFTVRSQAYIISGQPEKALEDAAKAINLNPDYAQAYMMSGQAHETMLDYNTALDDYDKAFSAAEKANQLELAAVARTRMAMVMQMMGSQLTLPGSEPTPTE